MLSPQTTLHPQQFLSPNRVNLVPLLTVCGKITHICCFPTWNHSPLFKGLRLKQNIKASDRETAAEMRIMFKETFSLITSQTIYKNKHFSLAAFLGLKDFPDHT